ncbi:hypothetical protein QYE76_064226 [Lolium multiflorum]|uniref:Transposase-associated domain-containing protein n=1 Tax=Lolium multiflorum TaxID=4521 RepID=A0AAD8S7S9_LOLMU|nr:hypothetical protein QYE76_064226 [Lolium multiflorum]
MMESIKTLLAIKNYYETQTKKFEIEKINAPAAAKEVDNKEGVNSFLLVAEANKSKQGFMCCPCLKCKNEKDYSCSRDIKSHLLRFGFMSSYNVWTKHGEEGVMMEDGDEEEDNDDQYRSMFSECFDTAMDDNEEEGGEEHASDDPVDDDLRCEDGHRKLGCILELLKWKAEVGVTDSGFEKLMIILKKLFPRNNELPVSTYEAKKLVCPLGLDVQKIHACINDCILYRGEKYENLNKCPICGALRYKIRKDDPGDVEGEPPRKRVPAKVVYPFNRRFLQASLKEKGKHFDGEADPPVPRSGADIFDMVKDLNVIFGKGTRKTARLLRTSTRPAIGCGGAAGLSSVLAYRGPRLRYPQSQPTRAHPPRLDNRDPDASDDDVGDYDDYSGEYYRARHDYD